MKEEVGALFLLLTTSNDNTIPLKMHRSAFAWNCSQQGNIDLFQVMVYPKTQADLFDQVLLDIGQATVMKKTIDRDFVIYHHKSLDQDGIFHSGLHRFSDVTDFSVLPSDNKLSKFIKTHPPIFSSGMILDQPERKSNTLEVPFTEEKVDHKWHRVHPSNITTNCFDGCTLVDITSLIKLEIIINSMCWLKLNHEQLKYLSIVGQNYFPLSIYPFRIDLLTMSARWEQPTPYAELYEKKILQHVSWHNYTCGCGCTKKCKPPTKFQKEIYEAYNLRENMKYLYNNQNPVGRQSVYTIDNYWLHAVMDAHFIDNLKIQV